MNHLRDLIESLKDSVNAPSSSSMTAEGLDRMAGWCTLAGERAVSFFLGNIAEVSELQVIPELVRLPYPTCWFECDITPESQPNLVMCGGLLIHTKADGTYFGQVWTKLRGEWRFIGTVIGNAADPGNWAISDDTEVISKVVALQTRAVQCFLSALHCGNVRRQEHSPETKLQKARAKRGKAPLFSYWTLQLDGKSDRCENHGGTHSSPRVHLRRGHPRQYAIGKWTWVQACSVGSKVAGIVHKDYSVGNALVTASRQNFAMVANGAPA